MKKSNSVIQYIVLVIALVICAGMWGRIFMSNRAFRKDAVCARINGKGCNQEMYKAAELGCLEKLRQMEQNNTTDTVTPELTKLLQASIVGDVKTVRKMIREGIDIHAIDSDPFTHACERGHLEIVKEFIKAGVDVNVQQSSNPLSAAAAGNHIEVVKVLLEAGANPNLPMVVINDKKELETMEESALEAAAWNDNLEMAKLLLDAGADVKADHNGALYSAGLSSNLEMIKLFINAGADVNDRPEKSHFSLWAMAYGKKESEIVKVLEDAGFKPDKEQKNAALIVASGKGNLDIVKELLADGNSANWSTGKSTPLIAASSSGNVEIVNELLKAGADVNKTTEGYNQSALIAASLNGHPEVVQILLDAGANPNFQESTASYTAINYIAHQENGSLEILKKLLEAGADPNIQTKYGDTALVLALDWGRKPHPDFVAPLVESGAADVNFEAKNGNTALNLAAAHGETTVVKFLLDHGAKVNAQNATKHDTALIIAADGGHLEVVKMLLEAGADPFLTNDTGKTARQYAERDGFKKIAKVLTDAEAAAGSKDK